MRPITMQHGPAASGPRDAIASLAPKDVARLHDAARQRAQCLRRQAVDAAWRQLATAWRRLAVRFSG